MKTKPSSLRAITILCAYSAIFALLAVWVATAHSQSSLAGSPFNVGYRIIGVPYQKDGQKKTLTVAVWYPTAETPKPYGYGGPTRGNVALNAELLNSDGPYPLLVFSHGYGGGGISSVFFTEALAAKGWIVAAPDHGDNYSVLRIRQGQVAFDRQGFLREAKEITLSNPENRNKYLYRVTEMQAVIDYLLTTDPFHNLVDVSRLAVGGHSMGGFTALGVCGTIKAQHDSRIKAVLLFSTGAGGYLFTGKELQAVKIPLMLFLGERERKQMRGGQTMTDLSEKIYEAASGPKYFLEIKGANHFSFNNRLIDNSASRRLSGTGEQFDAIRRYSIAFLEKHVAGRQSADPTLNEKHPLVVRYLKEPVAERTTPVPEGE